MPGEQLASGQHVANAPVGMVGRGRAHENLARDKSLWIFLKFHPHSTNYLDEMVAFLETKWDFICHLRLRDTRLGLMICASS